MVRRGISSIAYLLPKVSFKNSPAPLSICVSRASRGNANARARALRVASVPAAPEKKIFLVEYLSTLPAKIFLFLAGTEEFLFLRILPAPASVCRSAPDGLKEYLSTALYNRANQKPFTDRSVGRRGGSFAGDLLSLARTGRSAWIWNRRFAGAACSCHEHASDRFRRMGTHACQGRY